MVDYAVPEYPWKRKEIEAKIPTNHSWESVS